MHKRLILLILIISLFWSQYDKGAAMGKKIDYKTEIKEKIKQVDVSDGVSKEEAVTIAQNYMLEESFNVKDVIDFLKPKVGNSGLIKGCWAIIFHSTFKVRMKSGLKWYTVHIDKKTGEIKSQGWGPDL